MTMAERVCSASQDMYLHLIQIGRERARLAHCSITVLSHQPTWTRRYWRCAADCGRETAYSRGTGTTLLLSWRPAEKERTQTSKPQQKDTRGPQCPQTYTFRNIWVTSAALDSEVHQCSQLYPCSLLCQPTHFSRFCPIHLAPALFEALWNLQGWMCLSHPEATPHTQNTRSLLSAC